MQISNYVKILCLCWLCLATQPAHAISAITIDVDNIESEQGNVRNLKLRYQLSPVNAGAKQADVTLNAQFKPINEKIWSDLSLSCDRISLPAVMKKPATGSTSQQWGCEQGKLVTAHINAPFSFSLSLDQQHGSPQISASLNLKQANLSDAAGLHAGEKISAQLSAKATHSNNQWAWQAHLDWLAGEAFWQPFYFASAGHSLQASGVLNAQFLNVDAAELSLKNVGKASFSGQWRLGDNTLQALTLSAPNLDLEALYPLLLKPLLEKTSLDNLEMAGNASLQLTIQGSQPTAFLLDLDNVDVDDKDHRFALYKLNASIPWDYDEIKNARLTYAGGNLLKVPLGPASIHVELNRYALTAPQVTLPILDGALNLADVSAAWANNEWHWHLRANVVPIDMVELSQALGLPRMEGKVAASIPLVTYSAGQLGVDGEMGFNLFDGSILVKNLAMQTPLGSAPRLTADMQMRNLDLGALTRTFAFGAIEGKLDGDVSNLQLVNWKPVNFDADFHSSDGRYPKKISQRAVENISALGGAGAAAAIQRSFLRFLKEFNYQKIGLSCKLRKDVCEMNGVESTGQGYVIVKGSGVPSITVMGYNHSVNWSDLLERIKRITTGNVAPIIK
ncbi:MAG: hypothetical protein ACAH10_00730 [Methylophilaceae bacterium]